MNRLPGLPRPRVCAVVCRLADRRLRLRPGTRAAGRQPRRHRQPTTSTRSWRRCWPGATSIAGRSTSTSSTRPSRSKSSARAAGRCIARGATSPGTSATACTSAARSVSTASRSARRRATEYETNWIRRERERQERRAKRESEKDKEKSQRGVGRDPRSPAEGVQISTGGPEVDRAALRVGSLFHGLQVRAGQLLPGRPGKARRPRGAEGRVLPHQDVRRLRRRERTSGEQKEKSTEKPAEARANRRGSGRRRRRSSRTSSGG